MSDDKPASGEGASLTRRQLLAVAGVSGLAGCSSLDGLGGGSERTIRAYDLPDVDPDSVLEPIIPPAVPVETDPTHLTGARERTTTLLAELPTPLGPDDIPNGRIRREVTGAAETATDGLDEARTARTDLLALQSLRGAREHARYAAAGWAVADRGLSVDPLRETYRTTVSEAQAFRNDYEYVGSAPAEAALVHARIEERLGWVIDGEQPRIRDAGELLTVAQWGEAVESARASLSDARHLNDQFTSSLPDDAGTVEGVLVRAAESLFDDVRSRLSELPPEPTAEEWGPSERVVVDLRREADSGPDSVAEADGPASAVVDLLDRLVKFGALDTVGDRVDAGEIASVESAAALHELRRAAYEALETALEESPSSTLARPVISDVSWRVTGADRDLARYQGDVSPERLDGAVTDYTVATAVARATPAVCQRALDALGAE